MRQSPTRPRRRDAPTRRADARARRARTNADASRRIDRVRARIHLKSTRHVAAQNRSLDPEQSSAARPRRADARGRDRTRNARRGVHRVQRVRKLRRRHGGVRGGARGRIDERADELRRRRGVRHGDVDSGGESSTESGGVGARVSRFEDEGRGAGGGGAGEGSTVRETVEAAAGSVGETEN